MSVSQRVEALYQQLGAQSVTVVAVTKYATLPQMVEAYEAGIRHFGENKVQDALQKMEELPPEVSQGVTWHLIGHLQSNKVNKVVGSARGPFGLIHSVDSLELAMALSQKNQQVGQVQKILLQVNVSKEATKHGFSSEGVAQALPQLVALPGVSVKGLMTMAPATSDEARIREVFCGLRDLRDQLAQQVSVSMPELSMGMSQDYVHAIACGATIIRVGTWLFQSKIL